jgi:FtsP/CotA-like multicopper oxidase with cupredoxin domain
MVVRTRLVGGVVAVLMPLAACGGDHGGQQASDQQENCLRSPVSDNGKITEIKYLSIGKDNLDYLKGQYKVANKDIHYPQDFPLTSSATPAEQPTSSGGQSGQSTDQALLTPIEVDNPRAFEELKSLDELPYKEEAEKRVYNDLTVGFSNPNDTRIAGCGLTLRTYAYSDKDGKSAGKLVAPTIRVKPGQTMKFTVHNNLNKPEPGKKAGPIDLTNLHTHGMEVDPCGKAVGNNDKPCGARPPGTDWAASDNVLIEYGPGQSQLYEITVPDDHPSGTFWYHPHRHESTAPQVASGMAGALIVEDRDQDLPPLLKKIRDKGKEKTLVFQSMLYDDEGKLEKLPEGPEVWGDSGRRVTINGQIAPVITMRPGEFQRWRMISSSIHELLRVQLAGHDLNEIAVDGHYLPQVDIWKESNPNHGVDLLAGYRSDVLVKASKTPGVYMLVNAKSPLSRFNSPDAEKPERQRQQVLAAVVVAGHPVADEVDEVLPTSDQMKKIAYKPAPDVNLEKKWTENNNNPGASTEKFGEQKLQFDALRVREDLKFSIGGKVFGESHHDEKPRELVANQIDRWELTTATNRTAATPTPQGAHIFHIHINPFQVRRAGPGDRGGEKNEIVWKDSIVVPAGPPVHIYTQYDQDLTGKSVLHCHLLDHEDGGMMELVEVVKK